MATSAVTTEMWGANNDIPVNIPVCGDFDGDGKNDVAVFRSSTGDWIIQRWSDATTQTIPFGANGDEPIPADYDGDGRTQAASKWAMPKIRSSERIRDGGESGLSAKLKTKRTEAGFSTLFSGRFGLNQTMRIWDI